MPAHRALPTEILAQPIAAHKPRRLRLSRVVCADGDHRRRTGARHGATAALDLTLERINKSPKAIAYSSMTICAKRRACSMSLPEAATLIEPAVLHAPLVR